MRDPKDPHPESKMKNVYRVVARVNVVLFQSEYYAEAEKFCWAFAGGEEIHIEKVWVPKE